MSSGPVHKKQLGVLLWAVIVLLAISTSIIIYISTFKSLAFDLGFYEKEYQKYNIRDRFSPAVNLTYETVVLLDYLGSGEGRINSTFFDEREITHLKEVRDLYKRFFSLLNICMFLSVISIILLFFLVGRRIASLSSHNQDAFLKLVLSRVFVSIGLAVFVFFLFFLILVFTFDSSFIRFHELFFKTDTWMLDPAKDNLIRMYPQGFFEDIFTRIILQSVFFGFFFLLLGVILKHWDNLSVKFIKRHKKK